MAPPCRGRKYWRLLGMPASGFECSSRSGASERRSLRSARVASPVPDGADNSDKAIGRSEPARIWDNPHPPRQSQTEREHDLQDQSDIRDRGLWDASSPSPRFTGYGSSDRITIRMIEQFIPTLLPPAIRKLLELQFARARSTLNDNPDSPLASVPLRLMA
jgi:hypothetical protein